MTKMQHEYIHGGTTRERDRLDAMNRLINPGCLREMNLTSGLNVLDVGAGPGQFSREMARAVQSGGSVVGVERDEAQIDDGRRRAAAAGDETPLDMRVGDAIDLPLGDDEFGSFDVAHARFVLEHVPQPERVVEQMLRAVRPGGRVILADDDHDVFRLWPEPPGMMEAWRAYLRTYDRIGCDPYVGRRLVSLLHQAGAEPVRTACVFYGGCSGDPAFVPLMRNIAEVLIGAQQRVVDFGLADAASYQAGIDALDDFAARPDAALWYVINYAEGRRPQ